MEFTWKRFILFSFFIVNLSLVTILWYHQVDKHLTEEDKQYIPMFLTNVSPLSDERTYEEEINFIKKVQASVLTIAPLNKGLPYGQEREPKDLYEAKIGLCFDRSRVIEKILQYNGFQSRHVFIYSTKQTGSALQSFITPHVPSHAVTEVLTKRGWLVVDSNDYWISVDLEDNPKSMEEIKASIEQNENIHWKIISPPIYKNIVPFTFVYGLYSRHGKFYPPYNFIPDVNYSELIDNIF